MSDTFQLLLPQTVLAVLGSLFFLGGTVSGSPRRWGPLALISLAIAAGALHYASRVTVTAGETSGVVTTGLIPLGFQWCCLVVAAIFVLMSMPAQAESETAAEFYALLLLMLSGLMLVAAANDLVLLFLSLELISIPTYVLLYLGRRDYASQEATVKYFLLSVLSAAILLYGFAFLYGLTGSTRLDAIHNVLAATYQNGASSNMPPAGASVLGILALVLILAGLGFKLTAVPFHFYAPDVYEGTSSFNAGLLAVIPKAAGLMALIRVVSETMVGYETTGQQLALILAAITMTGGNCLALLQTNVRRMLAYSSVAHAGYMLIGIAVGFWEEWNPGLRLDATGIGLPGGVRASLLYLLAYSVTSAGLFAVLVCLNRPGKQIDHVDDLTGLGKTHPFLATAAALFLFSLAGIPPLPGFWGKLSVFSSALSVRLDSAQTLFEVHPAFALLAIVGVINAAIGAVYYLRLVAVMFLNDPLSTARPSGGVPGYAAVVGSLVLVLAFGLLPRPVFDYLEGGGQVQETSSQAAIDTPQPVVAEK